MAKSANMSIRIDPEVKSEVEAIYSRYGMSITDAINVFLYQSKNVGGLPFDLRPPEPDSVSFAALKDSGKGKEPEKSKAAKAKTPKAPKETKAAKTTKEPKEPNE